MALGKQIRRYRSALGLTLEQLEARTGVGVGTIAALEGRDSERSKYASRLAAGLGLTLEQLLDESADAGSGSGSLVLDSPHQPSTDDDDLRIPRFDTGGAMGAGVELRDQPGVIQSLRVSQEWLHRNVRHYTAANKLCVVTGFGDSMRPMFNPGDPLLVDLGVEKADIDGVFFFRVGNEGSSSACSAQRARPADPREIGKPQVRRLGHYRRHGPADLRPRAEGLAQRRLLGPPPRRARLSPGVPGRPGDAPESPRWRFP